MSQQPKTETDRLANVLQVLQLGQKTGRLLVERDNGLYGEQGIITLVNGQVVQASLNQLQGPEAFNQLKNWGACRFAFLPEAGSTPLSGLPRVSSTQSGISPLRQRAQEKDQLRRPEHLTGSLTGPISGSISRPIISGPISLNGSFTGPVTAPGDAWGTSTQNFGGARPPLSFAWESTPYRTRQIEEGMHLVEQMGLSRLHRRLLLLIDGGRTVRELVRLMAQDPAEVQRLLLELERAGVIRL